MNSPDPAILDRLCSLNLIHISLFNAVGYQRRSDRSR